MVGEFDCCIVVMIWDKVCVWLGGDEVDNIVFFWVGFIMCVKKCVVGSDVLVM